MGGWVGVKVVDGWDEGGGWVWGRGMSDWGLSWELLGLAAGKRAAYCYAIHFILV